MRLVPFEETRGRHSPTVAAAEVGVSSPIGSLAVFFLLCIAFCSGNL